MNIRYTLITAATGIALLIAAPVNAGGPVIIEDKADLIEDDRNGAWILPVLGIIALGLLIGGRGETCFAPEPETEGGGC